MLNNLKFPLSIKFAENFETGSDNYVVFQVDEGIIDEICKDNNVEIKGSDLFFMHQSLGLDMEDKAILTTSTKTYDLQRREFSNTFLFSTVSNDPVISNNMLEVHSKQNQQH